MPVVVALGKTWFGGSTAVLAIALVSLFGCNDASVPEADRSNNAGSQLGNDRGLPVLVTWKLAPGEKASLDVVLRNGRVIAPCIGANLIQREVDAKVSDGKGYLFSGLCVSPDILPVPEDIAAFQVCTAPNNDWGKARCARADWPHTRAKVEIDNAPPPEPAPAPAPEPEPETPEAPQN